MNAPAVNGAARAAAIALILVLATGAGLAVGNLIQQVSVDRSITADASFSRDALDDLHALRAGQQTAGAATAPAAYPDYGVRHAAAAASYPDWAIRHPATAAAIQITDTFRLTGPSQVAAPADVSMTDTFRLTGPSDVERTQLRGDAPEFVDYVDQARQRSAAASGTSSGYVDYVDQARQRSAGR